MLDPCFMSYGFGVFDLMLGTTKSDLLYNQTAAADLNHMWGIHTCTSAG